MLSIILMIVVISLNNDYVWTGVIDCQTCIFVAWGVPNTFNSQFYQEHNDNIALKNNTMPCVWQTFSDLMPISLEVSIGHRRIPIKRFSIADFMLSPILKQSSYGDFFYVISFILRDCNETIIKHDPGNTQLCEPEKGSRR